MLPPETMLTLMGSGYAVKVLYETVATPLTYWVVNSLKRAEGVEIFDSDTNFSPFSTADGGKERPMADGY